MKYFIIIFLCPFYCLGSQSLSFTERIPFREDTKLKIEFKLSGEDMISFIVGDSIYDVNPGNPKTVKLNVSSSNNTIAFTLPFDYQVNITYKRCLRKKLRVKYSNTKDKIYIISKMGEIWDSDVINIVPHPYFRSHEYYTLEKGLSREGNKIETRKIKIINGGDYDNTLVDLLNGFFYENYLPFEFTLKPNCNNCLKSEYIDDWDEDGISGHTINQDIKISSAARGAGLILLHEVLHSFNTDHLSSNSSNRFIPSEDSTINNNVMYDNFNESNFYNATAPTNISIKQILKVSHVDH